MDGEQGALNKVEHALQDAASGDFAGAKSELAAAGHDLLVSTEKLLGRATTDAEKLFVVGIQTLTNDLATPLGQAASVAVGTAIADGIAGKSVSQIGADVLPTLEASVVSDAKAAGQDAENVVLNTARVMLLGQATALTASPVAPPASVDPNTSAK